MSRDPFEVGKVRVLASNYIKIAQNPAYANRTISVFEEKFGRMDSSNIMAIQAEISKTQPEIATTFFKLTESRLPKKPEAEKGMSPGKIKKALIEEYAQRYIKISDSEMSEKRDALMIQYFQDLKAQATALGDMSIKDKVKSQVCEITAIPRLSNILRQNFDSHAKESELKAQAMQVSAEILSKQRAYSAPVTPQGRGATTTAVERK